MLRQILGSRVACSAALRLRVAPSRPTALRSLCTTSVGEGKPDWRAQEDAGAFGAASEAAGKHEEADQGAGESDAEQRLRLLEAAMLHVPEKGWTIDALSAGAVACGLSPAAHGMLPRGPVELVEHFVDGCDQSLAEQLAQRQEELASLETQNRLLMAMQTRLQMLEPHVGMWSQALALRTLPTNLPTTLQSVHNLSGTLLSACGEEAQAPLAPALLDPHVKRAAIGAIYGAAELYMLTDRSPGYSDTWLFVDREVNSLHTAANVGAQLMQFSPANLIMSFMARR